MDDDNDDGRERIVEVDIWECLVDAVAAFQLCQIEGIGTMAGVLWTGVSACEARQAIELINAPRENWQELAEDLRYMGIEAASERNRRQSAESRGKRGR